MAPLNQLDVAARRLSAEESPFTAEQQQRLASIKTEEALIEALSDEDFDRAFRRALQIDAFRYGLREEHERLTALVGPPRGRQTPPAPSAIPPLMADWRSRVMDVVRGQAGWQLREEQAEDRIAVKTPDGPAEIFQVEEFAVARWPGIDRLGILFGVPDTPEFSSWVQFRLRQTGAARKGWKAVPGADWETPFFSDDRRMALVTVNGKGDLVAHILNRLPSFETEVILPDWKRSRTELVDEAGLAFFVGQDEGGGVDPPLDRNALTGEFDFPALHEWLTAQPSVASDALRSAMEGNVVLAISPTHLAAVSLGENLTAFGSIGAEEPDYLIESELDLPTLLPLLANPGLIDSTLVSFAKIIWGPNGPRVQIRENEGDLLEGMRRTTEEHFSFILRTLLAQSRLFAEVQGPSFPGDIDEGHIRIRPFRDIVSPLRDNGFSYFPTDRPDVLFFVNRERGAMLALSQTETGLDFFLFDEVIGSDELAEWDRGKGPVTDLVHGRHIHSVMIKLFPRHGNTPLPTFDVPLARARERNSTYVDLLVSSGYEFLGATADKAAFVSLAARRTLLLLGEKGDSLVIVPRILRRSEILALPPYQPRPKKEGAAEAPTNVRRLEITTPKPEPVSDESPGVGSLSPLFIGGLVLGSSFLPGCGSAGMNEGASWAMAALAVAGVGLSAFAFVRGLMDILRENSEHSRRALERVQRSEEEVARIIEEARAGAQRFTEELARRGEEQAKLFEQLARSLVPPEPEQVPRTPQAAVVEPFPVQETRSRNEAVELVGRLLKIVDKFERGFEARKVEAPSVLFQDRLASPLRALYEEIESQTPHGPDARRDLVRALAVLQLCRKLLDDEPGALFRRPLDGTVQERYEATTLLARYVILRLRQQIVWFAEQEGVPHGIPQLSKGERELLDAAPGDSSPKRYFREADPLIRAIGLKINLIRTADWCDPKWEDLLARFRAKLGPRGEDVTMDDYLGRLKDLQGSLGRHIRILNDAQDNETLDSELGKRARRSLAIILRRGKGRQLKETLAQERAVAVAASVSSVSTGKRATVLTLVVNRGPSQPQAPSPPAASPRGPGGTPPPSVAFAQPALALSDSEPVAVEDQHDRIQIARSDTETSLPHPALFREALRLLVATGRKTAAVTLARNPGRLTPSQLAQLILHLRSQQVAHAKGAINQSLAAGLMAPIPVAPTQLPASSSPLLLLK